MTDPTPTRDEAVRKACHVLRQWAAFFNDDSARQSVKEIIDLLASAPAPASGGVDAVAIKPLQWEAKTGGCTATGLGINYAMGEQDPGMFCLFHPFHTEQMPQAQIQAIAQADYEQRIRSVIYSAEATDTEQDT